MCLGLALQGLAPEPALAAGLTTPPTAAPSNWTLKLLGAACMLLSSMSYSFLGVSYDLLVRSEGPTPTHSEVMFYTAKIGGFCLPSTLAPETCLLHFRPALQNLREGLAPLRTVLPWSDARLSAHECTSASHLLHFLSMSCYTCSLI